MGLSPPDRVAVLDGRSTWSNGYVKNIHTIIFPGSRIPTRNAPRRWCVADDVRDRPVGLCALGERADPHDLATSTGCFAGFPSGTDDAQALDVMTLLKKLALGSLALAALFKAGKATPAADEPAPARGKRKAKKAAAKPRARKASRPRSAARKPAATKPRARKTAAAAKGTP
jgi:hypothetical protein